MIQYTLIKSNPTTNELEVHYNPYPEPISVLDLQDWKDETIIVPFASDDDKEMIIEKEGRYFDFSKGIEVDCIEVRDSKAYFKEPVKSEPKCNTFDNGWISVDDKKPELGVGVNLYLNSGFITTGYFAKTKSGKVWQIFGTLEKFNVNTDSHVLYWQPLPPPPTQLTTTNPQ